jgi:acid phosphatase
VITTIAVVCGLALPVMGQGLPKVPPSHVVVVVMENRAAQQIIGSADAPYINALAKEGASFTRSYAVAHPSEPNYLALFSGSTHDLTRNTCPLSLSGPNLARSLIESGRTFVGYSEGLPSRGFDGCTAAGGYARKHAPWVNYSGLPASTNEPFAAFPAGDFDQLPTVAFVVPNLANDMHDGTIAAGDAWLRRNIDPFVRWAKTHDALLILTWDEDDGRSDNQIATILHGPMVKAGVYTQRIDHYSVLRTIGDLYSLSPVGKAADAAVIGNAWRVNRGN